LSTIALILNSFLLDPELRLLNVSALSLPHKISKVCVCCTTESCSALKKTYLNQKNYDWYSVLLIHQQILQSYVVYIIFLSLLCDGHALYSLKSILMCRTLSKLSAKLPQPIACILVPIHHVASISATWCAHPSATATTVMLLRFTRIQVSILSIFASLFLILSMMLNVVKIHHEQSYYS